VFILPYTAQELVGSWWLGASLGCVAMVLGWIAVMAGKRTTRATVKVTLTLYACFLSTAVHLVLIKGFRRCLPEVTERNLLRSESS